MYARLGLTPCLATASATEELQFLRVLAGTVTAAALALLGWLLRGRLPHGAGAGMFVGGIVAAILIGYLPEALGSAFLLKTAMLFAAASALMPAAVLTLGRRYQASAAEVGVTAAGGSQSEVILQLMLHCGVLAGLVAAAGVLSLLLRHVQEPVAAFYGAAAIVIVGLLLGSLGAGWLRAGYGVYAGLAGGGALLWIWLNTELAATTRMWLGWATLALATLSILMALYPEWVRTRVRRRLWLTDPAQLLGTSFEMRRLAWLTLLVCALVGWLTVGLAGMGRATWSAALAAIAASTVTHRQFQRHRERLARLLRNESAGVRRFPYELGLTLVALSAALSMSRMAAPVVAGWLGATVAALWMLWLARFWRQQLRDGEPWTTAGALIPAARRLGCAGACCAAAFGLAWWLGDRPKAADWVWVVLMLGQAGTLSLLVGTARHDQSVAAALCAGIAAAALALALEAYLGSWGWAGGGYWVPAAAAALLALRVGPGRGSADGLATAYNAQIAGIFPAAAIALFAAAPMKYSGAELGLCVGLLFLAALVRWSFRAPSLTPSAGR